MAVKKVTKSRIRKVIDPIVAAKARLDASGEDDLAHDTALADLESETPTTRRGADVLEAHTRYLQTLVRHDIVDQRRVRHLTKMMKRALSCRQPPASKRAG